MFIPGSLENGLPPSRCLQTGGCQISFIFPEASVWPMPPAATPLLRFLFLILRPGTPATLLSVIDARNRDCVLSSLQPLSARHNQLPTSPKLSDLPPLKRISFLYSVTPTFLRCSNHFSKCESLQTRSTSALIGVANEITTESIKITTKYTDILVEITEFH